MLAFPQPSLPPWAPAPAPLNRALYNTKGSGKNAGRPSTRVKQQNNAKKTPTSLVLFDLVADALPNVSMETNGKPLPFLGSEVNLPR